MDSSLVSDPRVRRLATIVGMSLREVIGTLFLVWLPCYQRRSPVMPADEIDLAADHDGFADAMVKSRLAVEASGGLLLAGVAERIKFLETQAVKSRAANEARWGHLRREAQSPGDPTGDPPGIPHGSPDEAKTLKPVPGASPSSPDLDLVPDLDLPEVRESATPTVAPLQLVAGRLAEPHETASTAIPSRPRSRSRFTAEHIAAAARVWAEQDRLRGKVIPGARALKPVQANLERVAALLVAGYSEADCFAVLQAVAKRVHADPEQARWFNGTTTWRPESFQRELGGAPPQRKGAIASTPTSAVAKQKRTVTLTNGTVMELPDA